MKQRILYFEGLRGIASLIVVFHHFCLAFYPAAVTKALTETHFNSNREFLLYNTPLGIFIAGNFAVYLFFILSGIVLTLQYIESKDKLEKLTEISITRYFRLLPAVLFCNVLVFFLLTWHWNFTKEASEITKSLWWLKGFWTVTPNLNEALEQSFFGMFSTNYPQSYNPALWVIAYFFLGTFLVTGTLALFGGLRRRYYMYAILILILSHTFFYPFIVGIWIADFFFNKDKAKVRNNKMDLLLLFFLGIYFGSYPIFTDNTLLSGTIYEVLPKITLLDEFGLYHALGASLIVISIILSNTLQKIVSFRIFTFIGKISYSLYIFHIIMIGTLCSYVFLQLSPLSHYNKSFLIMFAITFPLVILSSYLIHRYIERSGEILGKKFNTFITRN
jgi:peptidoglycan/LPS O-acetylase OafA/YrhL